MKEIVGQKWAVQYLKVSIIEIIFLDIFVNNNNNMIKYTPLVNDNGSYYYF